LVSFNAVIIAACVRVYLKHW